ncbi:MAG TPA: FG-GAP-like repeat-containing protein, partial [Fimbriiglobus sp.]|nr:FG-GAP-like repeat-containing protein [Fimbriiglobus sp.]
MTSPAPAPTPPRRRLFGLLAVLLLLATAGVVVWSVWFRDRPPASDLAAAARANARGVGYMEQFADGYPKAVAAFEEAVRLAPDWTDAKVNLGIALYNADQSPANLDRAAGVFRQILAADPNNPYAHHNLGVIAKYRGDPQTAASHFEAVTRIDPADPHAWLFLAQCDANPQESPQARERFAKALALNPYLNAARYGLISHTATTPDERTRLLAEFNALTNHPWQEQSRDLYTEFGKYATVIGKPPGEPPAVGPLPMFEKDTALKVTLADGVRWLAIPDPGPNQTARSRFGGTLVRFDYDKDGRPDLLLLSAVLRNGKLSDLLLRNEGNSTFTDVTEAMGLGMSASIGCSVGDFDNDGRSDLLLTGPAGVRLLRNEDGKKFADKSKEAGFDKLTGIFAGSAWVDLDQDGDLDAVLTRSVNGVMVQLNVGEAPPVKPGEPPKPLTCKFRPAEGLTALPATGAVTSFVVSDLDADRDVDLLILADNEPPTVVLNDRLMRFHRGAPVHAESATWTGGLVLDANGDGQSDLLLLGMRPALLTSKTDAIATDTAGRFAAGTIDSPHLKQAQAVDLDLDGRTDVVGLSVDRKPVFLQGDGRGKLTHRPGAFGPAADAIPVLLAVAACDLDGDCNQDIVTWSASAGLAVFRGTGNGNHGLLIELTGVRERASPPVLRTNADAIGATVTALAGPVRTRVENTTLSAGLGQSRLPLVLGLGRADAADAIRIRWPDGVPQSELNLSTCKLTTIPETDRRGGSCPVLLAWDGERFRYVTDFLGAGALGETSADGTTRPPRPEESVKIEPGQLVPRNGRYIIKIAEPMDEMTYLDRLRLDVIDHPAGVEVHPDERFAAGGPPPTQELLAFRERFAPLKATDQRGRDVTAAVRVRDGNAVDEFAHRSWIGMAEDHSVEFDFGNQLAGLADGKRVFLVLAGWTDYPYPEAIYAAAQAGVPMTAPVLERQTADGKWEPLGELGFPAGLPKVMTREVPGLAGTKGLKLRVRTNLQIYWDQVYLAPAIDAPPAISLPVSRATLVHRGFMKEVTPAGKRTPAGYTDDRTEPVAVSRWRGRLTRTGDVTALLTAVDDRFVLCGPGDEVTVEFDAAGLPPVKPGHVRSFVLRTHGYCKDTAPFTATGGAVGPLPFAGMGSYPAGAADRSKAPAGQAEYDREWNTRSPGCMRSVTTSPGARPVAGAAGRSATRALAADTGPAWRPGPTPGRPSPAAARSRAAAG